MGVSNIYRDKGEVVSKIHRDKATEEEYNNVYSSNNKCCIMVSIFKFLIDYRIIHLRRIQFYKETLKSNLLV